MAGLSQPHLLYVADPMRSWCWGLPPVIADIRLAFRDQLPVHSVMGGLRPGISRPMDVAAKAETRDHWEHVQAASDQPFDYGFFSRAGFVYDTEPAARAVVVLRRLGPDMALAALIRFQQAFYAENQDVTHPDVLTALAGELGVDKATFRSAFDETSAQKKTLNDFARSRAFGVRGFPTLIAAQGRKGPDAIATRGFCQVAPLIAALGGWLETVVPLTCH